MTPGHVEMNHPSPPAVCLGTNRNYQKQLWPKTHLLRALVRYESLETSTKAYLQIRPQHSAGNAFSWEGLTQKQFSLPLGGKGRWATQNESSDGSS